MTIAQKTATQYRQQIENEIVNRDNTIETQYGPVRDVVIRPAASVFVDQNGDIRYVENLQTLASPELIEIVDLDNLSFNNWQIKRLAGTESTGSVVFRTSIRPTVDIVVPLGFPVSTVRDDVSNTQIQFVTTQIVTMFAATADLFYNTITGFYELSVPIQAVSIGDEGIVAANRITVLQRPLSGISGVTNDTGTVGGTDQEFNLSVVERIQIARQGTDLSTALGIEVFTRQSFLDVEDILVVYGLDPLLTRASVDSGAVDGYIIGSLTTPKTDSYFYSGSDYVLLFQPVLTITSVTDGIIIFIQGVDYLLVKDAGIYENSVRAVDELVFLPAGAKPALGATVTVQYTINSLLTDLQDIWALKNNAVMGRDLLFKEANQIEITITANLSTLAGFIPSNVQANVKTAIKTYINALTLGQSVQRFDVSSSVFQTVQGVDNLVYTIFDEFGGAAVQDVVIGKNGYANIEDVNITVNLV